MFFTNVHTSLSFFSGNVIDSKYPMTIFERTLASGISFDKLFIFFSSSSIFICSFFIFLVNFFIIFFVSYYHLIIFIILANNFDLSKLLLLLFIHLYTLYTNFSCMRMEFGKQTNEQKN